MILQALADYHREQVAAGNPDYAPNGMELKRIHFVLVLRSDGIIVDIEQPKDKIGVIKSRERGGKDAPLTANRMWDNIGYVTGFGADDKQKSAAVIQHRSFVKLVRAIHCNYPENRSFTAVDNFYALHAEQLHSHPRWDEMTAKPGYNLSFRLEGESLLASQQKELLAYGCVAKYGRCVICGNHTKIIHTHPKLSIQGCTPTGAKLVSFTSNSGYDSYGKHGGANAPTCEAIAESYVAALTGLTQPSSGNCMVIGDVTLVFYTLPLSDFSNLFFALFGNHSTRSRAEVLEVLRNQIEQYSDAEFVLMAFVPNAARVSLRLSIKIAVKEVAANIIHYYEQTSIGHHFDTDDQMSLLVALLTVARQNSVQNLPRQLIVNYIEAVVCGTPLPVHVQQELHSRLREGNKITLNSCSLLRCYLYRNNKTHIPMALDAGNRDKGYILGRMLAIVERAQELSTPNISFTVRDSYYTILSTTPSAVFNRIIGLFGGYIRRIPTQGTTIFIKAQFGELTEMFDGNGVPVRLSLDQQSHFAIGYFHQRQSYFKKRDPNE